MPANTELSEAAVGDEWPARSIEEDEVPKKYSDDFKSSAAKQYLNTKDATYDQVAAELGVRPKKLRRWVLEYGQGLFQTSKASFTNQFHDSRVNNVIQAYTIEHLTLPAPASPGDEFMPPLQVGLLPPLATARQDRPVDLELASALSTGGTAVVCQMLLGMGGVGKTQIAAAYAYKQWQSQELDLLVWVNATSRGNVTAAFAEAADRVLRTSEGNNEEKACRFLSWLNRPSGCRWLIVIDDLTDPSDLVGLWPPHNAKGRTIVTTRRRDAALDGAGRHRVDVGLFTDAEAAGYLAERLGHDAQRLEGVAALAASLGYLPLALSQAAAYILDQPGLSCGDYRERFEDRANSLAELSPDPLPDGHEQTVATTWSLSIELADRRAPHGAGTALLRLASVLDPNGAPLSLFTSDTALEHLAFETPTDLPERSPVMDAAEVEQTLGTLRRLSLLDFDGAQVRVHALVQRAVFDSVDQPGRRMLPRVAADAVAEIWPEPDTRLVSSAILRSNVDHLQRNATEAMFTPAIHPVLFRAGYSLGSHGQVTLAAAHFQLLYETSAFALGPDHPDTLKACFNQAIWHAASGDTERAIDAFTTVVDGRCRTLGPDHPDTRTAQDGIRQLQHENEDASASSGLRLTYIGAGTRALT